MTTETKTPMTARARIREFVESAIEGQDEFSLTELSARASAELLSDPKFVRAFGEQLLQQMMYEEVQRVVARKRDLLSFEDQVLTPAAFERKKEQFGSRFLSWYEHSGDKHINVLKMSRPELLASADERDKRGSKEINLARLWRRLANGLEGDQIVEERFTSEEIESMYLDIEHAA